MNDHNFVKLFLFTETIIRGCYCSLLTGAMFLNDCVLTARVPCPVSHELLTDAGFTCYSGTGLTSSPTGSFISWDCSRTIKIIILFFNSSPALSQTRLIFSWPSFNYLLQLLLIHFIAGLMRRVSFTSTNEDVRRGWRWNMCLRCHLIKCFNLWFWLLKQPLHYKIDWVWQVQISVKIWTKWFFWLETSQLLD